MTSTEARFWAKVEKTDTCWLWTAYATDEYGQFHYQGKTVKAYRFAYELVVGPIPKSRELDHRPTCPKRCVNPAHLRPVIRKHNQENRAGPRKGSSSGVRGVVWDKSREKWSVQVMHHGKNYNGGRFTDLGDAKTAAIALRNRLYTHNDMDRVAA